MASLVLVDDHEIVTDSLKYLIEDQSNHRVIAKFKTAETALEYIIHHRLKINVVISDIKLPSMSGIELTKKIKETAPHIKVILLSQFSSREYIANGIKYGAKGYLLKSTGGNELVTAIDTVLSGKKYLCKESTEVLYSIAAEPTSELSERELDVLKCIALGCSNNEIASKLNIQPTTIEYHKRNIKNKLNVNTIADLTRIALEMGIVD